MNGLPGFGEVVWESLFRKGQIVQLDGSKQVTIIAINPVGDDAAKYTIKYPDGTILENVHERRLS